MRYWELASFLEPGFQRLALLLLAAGLLVFTLPYRAAHGAFSIGWLDLALVPPTLILMAVVHELAHAGAILALGGRPRIGMARVEGLPVPYATGSWLTGRWSFIAFALAPTLLLTAGGLYAMPLADPVLARQLYVLLSFNLSGSAADLVMAWAVLEAPAGSRVWETRERTAIYAPPGPRGKS